jgi:putative ABC transport system substrate-binding protein
MIFSGVLVASSCVTPLQHQVMNSPDLPWVRRPSKDIKLPARVAVIRDDDAALYSKAVLGIGVELEEEFVEYSLLGHASRGPELVKSAIAHGAQVIIAIGPKSANAAKADANQVPVIYCLVPRVEDYDLERPNVVGIRLEVPIARQLTLLKSLFGEVLRVAVVADKDASRSLLERVSNEAKKQDVEIVVAQAKLPTAVAGALHDLQTKVDAMLLLSDPVALNISSFDAMVEFAREKKIPFLALDDGFVARGALLSYVIDYGLTGRQAASMANRVLNDGMSLKDMRIVEHEGLNLAVNMTTADALFRDGTFSRKLLRLAAEQRYGIEAF